MKPKQMLRAALLEHRERKIDSTIQKRVGEVCMQHPEWEKLTSDEEQYAYSDPHSLQIYKNIRHQMGYSIKPQYYVSDIRYRRKILSKLNYIDVSDMGFYAQSYTPFSDKNYQGFFIKQIKSPKAVIRNVNGVLFNEEFNAISQESSFKILDGYNTLVFKKSIGAGHGAGVRKVTSSECKEIIKTGEKNYIIQEILKQHESFAYYNESSVNVVRITTVNWKGTIYVLSGIMRIGAPGAFCDHLGMNGFGPLIIPIKQDGSLEKVAIDPDNAYIYNNVWGKEISDKCFEYGEMVQAVKREHIKFPNYGILGWDMTLDVDGNIVCIEYNPYWPGVVQSQLACGEIFMQKTVDGNLLLDEILAENLTGRAQR